MHLAEELLNADLRDGHAMPGFNKTGIIVI